MCLQDFAANFALFIPTEKNQPSNGSTLDEIKASASNIGEGVRTPTDWTPVDPFSATVKVGATTV